MTISFEVSAFQNDPRGLVDVLSNLHRIGLWSLYHDPEVERIACRTPGSAYNLCRFVNHARGVSRGAERVFLKNPNVGIKYLRLVNRRAFLDEDTQARFWRKVLKKPDLAYSWANAFRVRLSDEEEEVFVGDVRKAKDYAFFVRKEPFSESVHNKLVLRSFEDMDRWSKGCLEQYIKWAAERL
jgi:hypothetical protein